MDAAEPAWGVVAVVGAVNVDLVVTVDTLPGPGQTVLGPELVRHGGGKGANAAVAAARAGATVRFVGAVGDDDLGRGAVGELTGEGVVVDDVEVHADVATGAALIVVDAAGENQIAVGAGANARVTPAQVRQALRSTADLAVVLVSTEVPADAVVTAVGTAAELGVRCVLNPAPVVAALVDLLGEGPILTPNEGEVADLARATGATPRGPEADARALRELTGAPVVVTLGGHGALLVDPTGTRRIDPVPTTVRDTTGAGDAFNGVLAARLAAGDDLADAADAANRAAAASAASVGARTVDPSRTTAR